MTSSPKHASASAIDRIIAAVGVEPKDRNGLMQFIDYVHYEYLLEKSYRGTKAADTHRLVKRIRSGLEKSAQLINSNQLIKRATDDHSLAPLIAALRELEDWRVTSPKPKGRGASAVELLIGWGLPAVYEAHFGKGGKRVAFIEAALVELKLAHNHSTIIRALRRCAKMRKDYRYEEIPSLDGFDMPEVVRKALSGRK